MSFNQNPWNRPPPNLNSVPQFDRWIPPPPIPPSRMPFGNEQQPNNWTTPSPATYQGFTRPPDYGYTSSTDKYPMHGFDSSGYCQQNPSSSTAINSYHMLGASGCEQMNPQLRNQSYSYSNVMSGSSSQPQNMPSQVSKPRIPTFSQVNSSIQNSDSYQQKSESRDRYLKSKQTQVHDHQRSESKQRSTESVERKDSREYSSSSSSRDYSRQSHRYSDRKDRDKNRRHSKERERRTERYHSKRERNPKEYSSNKKSRIELEKVEEKTSMNSRSSSSTSSRFSKELLNEKPSESDEERILNEFEEEEEDKTVWTRSSPADLYYKNSPDNPKILIASDKLKVLTDRFDYELVQRGARIRANKPKYEKPVRKVTPCKKAYQGNNSSESSDESSDEGENAENDIIAEMESKKKHPDRLHEELWYNDSGEMNDGPLCRCSLKASRSGIRHSIYPGEGHLAQCDPNSNNANQLYHYRVTMSPHTNFVTKKPTIIKHDGHEFIFEGFSLFSHSKLDSNLPQCKVIRFNIEYNILYIEEKFPDNFTVRGLELFTELLYKEVLELVDLEFRAHNDENGCPQFHLMPRFVRVLEDHGKEILSMSQVLLYFLNSNKDLVDESQLNYLLNLSTYDWQKYTDEIKGMIVTYPGKKPCSIRVDQLDRELEDESCIAFPEIVHFGIRPPQLSYAGSPSYQKAWREYVKFRHLLANKPKVSYTDRTKLQQKEMALQDMRTKNNLKRDVTVAVSSKGFYRTGIMCDIVQHAMLIPVLICHLRFHKSLDSLERKIDYKFKNRYSLQLALTHPSYRENFGTNPDHARNSLTNCGTRQPEYGDRRIHFMNTRKRGISTLINIMSRFGQNEETASSINHNERLEFLGDAVVEFITSIHLFHMFPDLEEGGLATYRAAIVQNQHLAVLAKHLELEKYMLFAHGSDLCHDLELRHAMANCFEAVMGALFLDGGIEVSDSVFANTLFPDLELRSIWINYPQHVLQEQEPNGDRKWIESVPLLQKLTKFEESIGVEFTHIRLLARSFTMRSLGYNHLTLGSNQRLEFLGDTVLQLIASEYLYKFFPEHHEGHLSLLRSSLVNNRTQSVVCEDVGMIEYAINSSPKLELKTKDKADLLEAFLGALYVDKGLDYCKVFCQVCFFPRLQDFIMNQDWNDPKSKLQQCCLTLRSMDGGEPDIPLYKVIETKGPTNTRVYIVAVYFRGKRLSKGSGHSIQQAEMDAANNALASSKELFPQLVHQKRVIEKSLNCFKN